VGNKPLYIPLRPYYYTIEYIPCNKPRYLGVGDNLSWINLTFKVSAGVTTNIASETPAPKPAKNVFVRFFSLNTLFFNHSLLPNLTAVLGTEKVNNAAKPL